MKIDIDFERCCGAGQCVLAAPEVFDQSDETGLVILLDIEPADHLHDGVREAALACPAQCITVHE
ncbi:ferredoxin [Nocardioides humi]|uniref:Ferredoxin n=1 Tax=Nocardioides humi TaxID=449461 RepID=A0ABN2A531_9ACTN|nr:ferredoxin [Nocardioides humi]